MQQTIQEEENETPNLDFVYDADGYLNQRLRPHGHVCPDRSRPAHR